jgi:sodium-dependent phosphate transporter
MRGMADLEAQNREGYVDRLFNNAGKFWHDRVLSTRVGNAIFNNPITRTIGYGSQYKVHDVLNEKGSNYDTTVGNMWETAEVFDPKTERVFRYLQVFTACVMSFAHGSNDVANAVGPYSAIYTIWNTGAVPAKSNVELWILALGGAGIVLGLATYGYKIMRVLGVKSVKVTNARGFCMELATASTVILASRYGLPISTTQVITGAVLAVGLFEGMKGVNWRMFLRIFTGWVFTLVVAGFVAAAFTAWGVYSPSKRCADDSVTVIKALDTQTLKMIKELNTTTGVGATVTSQLKGFNNTLTSFYKTPASSPLAVEKLNMQVFNLYNSSICHK